MRRYAVEVASSSSCVPAAASRPPGQHQDAVGPADLRQAMVMISVVRPRCTVRRARWISSSVLLSMALVEIVQNEDARILEEGARQGEPLPLAAGQGSRRAPPMVVS